MVIIGTKVGILGQDSLAAILSAIDHLKSQDSLASRVFIIGSYFELGSEGSKTRRLSNIIIVQKIICMMRVNLMNMDNAIPLHLFLEIIFVV